MVLLLQTNDACSKHVKSKENSLMSFVHISFSHVLTWASATAHLTPEASDYITAAEQDIFRKIDPANTESHSSRWQAH